MPLARWLSRSYLHAAIIPLLLIETSFLVIYWVSGNFTYERNAEAVGQLSKAYLKDIANREANTIDATIDGVESLGKLFALETTNAFATPYSPPATEKARYGFSANGVFHTKSGGDQTASFFSGVVPIGAAEIDKVWRTAQLDNVMKHVKSSSPLIQQVYLNTHDSYNRIYPYFDVLTQYAPKMDIPSYNFYYEADTVHNPARKLVWTDAYVDPAGGGWMVSAIAPVYLENKLEAVVGIDVTVDTILNRILALNLPWNGYAMLIGRDGTILALPADGERDLGLTELKNHHYREAIRSNIYKPRQFNIRYRPDLKPLAVALARDKGDVATIRLGDKNMLAASAAIAGPGWRLVVMAPESAILADAMSLRDRLQTIAIGMFVILLVFYFAFFYALARRARQMSARVAQPLATIETLMDRIGTGDYAQQAPQFGVTELDHVAERLVAMGGKLGNAYHQIVEQEEEVSRALDGERRITRGQRRFINILSHEFRTPLTVIDSCGQILRRRASRMTEDVLLERADMIRNAAARIGDVMRSALQLVQLEEGAVVTHVKPVDFSGLISEIVATARETHAGITINDSIADGDLSMVFDPVLIRTALVAIIENACKFSPSGASVAVSVTRDLSACRVTITDQGPGIAAEELPLVCERFFRGSNSTGIPGAGTGLYLAATLIEAHGGKLTIDSVVDQGTIVTISLPHISATAPNLLEAA